MNNPVRRSGRVSTVQGVIPMYFGERCAGVQNQAIVSLPASASANSINNDGILDEQHGQRLSSLPGLQGPSYANHVRQHPRQPMMLVNRHKIAHFLHFIVDVRGP
jgi:hypothetical protein